MTPLLELRGVTCRFGGLVAVDNLSFALNDGHIVSLIGPNGAGKTTVFNCITGLQRPAAGSIFFGGQTITRNPPHATTRLGLARTFQNIRLFNELTALENVMAGQHARSHAGLLAAILRPPHERAEERRIAVAAAVALEFVGLSARAGDVARTLPYGEQRRLEIARALAVEPRLLILDEPAAGMNEAETSGLVELISRIRATGISILLVEHDMRLVMHISDHVLVMDQGRLIASGPPAAVRLQPQVIEAYLGVDEDEDALPC